MNTQHFTKVLLGVCLISLSGCIGFSSKSILGGLDSSEDASSAVVESKTASKLVDDVKKIEAQQKAEKEKIENKYQEAKDELREAYSLRQEADNVSFDYISEVNYGIYFLSKDYASDLVLNLINLKAEQNMYRLTPLSPEKKTKIEAEISAELILPNSAIKANYEKLIADSKEAWAKYEAADAKVTELEEKKTKIKEENAALLLQLEQTKAKALSDIEQAAAAAEERAKEQQLAQIRGWMAKTFAGVAILAIIVGIFMKSFSLILSGLLCAGMAIGITVIPLWAVFVFVGVMMVGLFFMNPPSKKKKDEKTPPPSPPPAGQEAQYYVPPRPNPLVENPPLVLPQVVNPELFNSVSIQVPPQNQQ